MPRARHSVSISLLSVILTFALISPLDSAIADETQTTAAKPSAKPNKPAKKPYVVRPGVTFNSALGSTAHKRAIISKVNSAISHTRKGQQIRIFSWKIWTRAGVTALLNAQKRGVKIRVIMDKNNTIVEKNPHFWRLRKGLKAGNRKRPKEMWSAARLCDHSCRGKGGAAHSKFMLFSKAGSTRFVYMNSSANWGDAAANLQWNDLYTFVGDRGIYEAAVNVFDQAWKDEPVKGGGWSEYSSHRGSIVVAWSPTTRKSRQEDRLLGTLRKVKCRGATGAAGNPNGRTIIRTAPDVIRGDRGMAVGRQLRRLWDRGCDVKVGYTVMGKDVSRLLRASNGRGAVPLRHLVQDFDGDGVFDRYFHLKVYTINGVIGRDTEATWMVSGSSNTSSLSQVSDESFVYFVNRPSITKRYQNYINYWFDNFPKSEPVDQVSARRAAVDPYAKMELD